MELMELMIKLEGLKLEAYDCTAGKRTVGIGFNMEAQGARKVWSKLKIQEDFDDVFYKRVQISKETASKLFSKAWAWCEKNASERARELNLDYDSMPEYKRFILGDIVYNTGSIKKWRKVLINETPESVLLEARRNPKEIMDSRVAKIGYHYGIVKDLEDAKQLGLVHAKYIV